MMRAKRRSGRRHFNHPEAFAMARYCLEQIRQLRQALAESPPQETGMSTMAAIALLADDIRALKARGYTLAMVADMLTAQGIPISHATLRTYLSRIGRPRQPKRKPKAGLAGKSPASNGPPLTPLASSGRFAVRPDTEDL
jgi:hypothetical protein